MENPLRVKSLGEGYTPISTLDKLAAKIGKQKLYIKDESQNPTGSFKARGLSVALARHKELSITDVILPSAGNAGGAAAAYAVRNGMTAHVYLPSDTPSGYIDECSMYGADVHLVDGLIDDCGRSVQEQVRRHGFFEISTLKEPFRIEGKKTMGLEIAEQFDWKLPDIIVYPTGGGTGFIGMWKAFEELAAIGWISESKPRMVVVQAENCAPLVRAFQNGQQSADRWENAFTCATGIRVPAAVGDFLILDIIRKSSGTAVSVSESKISDAQKELMSCEGISVGLEGAATWAAVRQLEESGQLPDHSSILIYNTGTPLKQKFPGLSDGHNED